MEKRVKKKEKGLSLEQCIRRAEEYVADLGVCVLAMDVKGSATHLEEEGNRYTKRLARMVSDLNHVFEKYLPFSKIIAGNEERGFKIIRGDQVIGAINYAGAIKKIYDYQKEHYPDIDLYWTVAKDGWDEKAFREVD
ncbi:hypothetical protein JXB28_03820 [Candidatus Woesearchaeota archaeon]|nr:hypothetical protein [Candidatus Woesearchaeota archaeon]